MNDKYYSARLKRLLTDEEVEEMRRNGAFVMRKAGCKDCPPMLIETRPAPQTVDKSSSINGDHSLH